jgi:hypothetical protein
VVLLVVLVGCSRGAPGPIQRETFATPVASPGASSPEARGITVAEDLTVDNAAFGRSRSKVAQAVADLKKVGLWKKLTGHLYVVKFGSRLGSENVPEDGHLADAYLTAQIDGDVAGGRCDVMFFTTAIKQDLTRWVTYHAQGLLTEEPPSLRQFWASIMAHELAHCLRGANGEGVAQQWEERALKALRAAGVP